MGCCADGREWIEVVCQSGAHFLNREDWDWDFGMTGILDFGMTLEINIEVDFVINAGIEIKIVLIND